MELPFFNHFSPVGSYSAQYLGVPGRQVSPNPDSDNSMDAEVFKLKSQEEDLFSWAGEFRVTIDDDKYQANGEVNISNQDNYKNQQSLPYCAFQGQNQYIHRNLQYEKDCQEQYVREYGKLDQYEACPPKEQPYTGCNIQVRDLDLFKKDNFKIDQMGKEETQFGKESSGNFQKMTGKAAKPGCPTRDAGDAGARAEIDIYLEKSQLAATGNQMACEMENGASATPGSRKRKLETAWSGGKRPNVSTSGQQRDMISAGRISAGWQVDDLDIDLSGELNSPSYNMSEALLSLPVFKQEAPSPTGAPRDPNSPPWMGRQHVMMGNNMGMNGNGANCSPDQHSPNMNQMGTNNANCSNNNPVHQQGMPPQSGGQLGMPGPPSPQAPFMAEGMASQSQGVMDVANGLLLCSPHGSLEGYSGLSIKPVMPQIDSISCQDNRFQYVLAAATSIATKCNEDTLTYLNQCQSYEIKLKKLGDLRHYRGKILKSIIRICFHERRLQYAEREQMSLWQSERPGERIVEVDVPLSYGLIHVFQPSEQPLLNTVELYWDPVKEAGVYIKVNCISTEFTAKKHGGEKGVPFRIQVETFLPGDGPGKMPPVPAPSDKRLHAAACQIKVFKLKGADRKHKQDREKILRRPPSERDKYQPSYECTVFTDLPNDAVFTTVGSGQPYSPEQCTGVGGQPARPSASSSASPPRVDGALQQLVLPVPLNEVKLQQALSRVNSHGSSLDCDEDAGLRSALQTAPASPGEYIEGNSLTESSTAAETRSWLSRHRFSAHAPTFANFSGADLLRLSRDDLIQICSLADGIRLYNALHAERAPARLTLYARKAGEKPFSALYLNTCQASELRRKLQILLQDGSNGVNAEVGTVLVAGPGGIRVHLTDEVIQNFKNDSMFRLEPVDGGILMKHASV